MSDAKEMAELAAEVAEKGYDWKQRAKASEETAERYLFRLHEVLTENKKLKEQLDEAVMGLSAMSDARNEAEDENKRLRSAVEWLGETSNTCVAHYLETQCSYCQCGGKNMP